MCFIGCGLRDGHETLNRLLELRLVAEARHTALVKDGGDADLLSNLRNICERLKVFLEGFVVFQESLPLQGAEPAPHTTIIVVVMMILVACAEERAGCRGTRRRCGEAGLALARRRLGYFEGSPIRIHTERRFCHERGRSPVVAWLRWLSAWMAQTFRVSTDSKVFYVSM